MKLGILILSVGAFGQKGLYNSQEIGLAKELCRIGHEVIIYKCIAKNNPYSEEELLPNLRLKNIPVHKIGNNSLFDCKSLDTSLNALICFSDIQLSVVSVYKWTLKHHIQFIPYVGIVESTSTLSIIRTLIALNAKRIYNIYNRNGVLVKTNAVKKKMGQYGVDNVRVAPVGLDFDLVNKEYYLTDKSKLKEKYGFDEDDKVYLMVGRFESDRNPMDCILVFHTIQQKNPKVKLLVIGKGSLLFSFKEQMNQLHLSEKVKFIQQVPNSQMWELYRLSEGLLTFSKTEIFGMSILEAMYYQCPVFAIHAPGPNDIIEHGRSGYLCENAKDMIDCIYNCNAERIGTNAQERVINNFSWSVTGQIINELIKK